MTKHGAYIWLQNRLCLREKDMHIGMFSEYRCGGNYSGV
ncbi:MAG: zinc-finger-containing protein [Ruminococcus sp.]